MIIFPPARIAFCTRHLAPLRQYWPHGYGRLCLSVLQAVLADDRFAGRFPVDDSTGLRQCDETQGNQALREVSPLCCFIGDDTMQILTAAVLADLLGPEKGH